MPKDWKKYGKAYNTIWLSKGKGFDRSLAKKDWELIKLLKPDENLKGEEYLKWLEEHYSAFNENATAVQSSDEILERAKQLFAVLDLAYSKIAAETEFRDEIKHFAFFVFRNKLLDKGRDGDYKMKYAKAYDDAVGKLAAAKEAL